ncbi:PAS domain S-box protein [Algoriphagus aquimarinus]|uniref:histidine kinase n=1 Tax=Algoriphagus aquimarinus TaxID=237018 RepID=A0A1I0VKE2_9BACT|nr:PAS domain S-box protein [Algoriphagus aquimarinus]SFA76497.1 PAS domain S-box-containing protein [Algoriphagus aquimarinus]
MINLEKSIKKRYILFISTIILIVLAALVIVQNSVNTQKHSALLISKASQQCMLSESITNLVFSFDNKLSKRLGKDSLNTLQALVDEFEDSHKYLFSINKRDGDNSTLDSLLKISDRYLETIVLSSKNIINNPSSIEQDVRIIAETESPYFLTMQRAVEEYQKGASENLAKLKTTIYFLALIAVLILVGEFLFVLMPALKQLFKKNDELLKANVKLSASENKIIENVLELTKLKTDLETKEEYNKIFIEQAPTAIAMLDNNMCYIAVSQRWIIDYKMEGLEIIGRSHYDLFPEIGSEWKENHQKCLKGAIDRCDEAPFKRVDGSVQWIYWDVRPWYISEGKIGGLLMHTGDITHIKDNEEERIRIEKILEKTNKVARIGTWDINLIKSEIFWSKMVREIHELPEDFEPDLETAINFFREGKSRDTISKAVKEASEYGTPYDVEVELVTANNKIIWTRAIGQAEIFNGKCVRLFGVFQDINDIKISQIALNKAHNELKAIFNSGPIAIISTNNEGIITHFNYGAEVLLGYSATEMIGLVKPEIYLLKEEIEGFTEDIAKAYGIDDQEFDPFMELAKRDNYDTREWTYRRKDGSTFPVQLTLTAIKNDLGEKIGFLSVSFDITERKATENDLLRKNQLLNFAEEITMMGHWQWDTVADEVKWSNNLYKMFELNEDTIDLKFSSYFNFVHPEDQQTVTYYFDKAANDKKFYSFTHRIITTKGKIKTVQLLGEVITNAKGDVIEMIGTGQDITEQKMAENKFRGLLESAPDAMVIANENGVIQLINKQAELLFGYSSEELFQKSVDILIPERYITTTKDFIEDFFSNPKTKGMREGKEFYGVNKSGKEIPVQISFSPLQTEEGILVSAAIRDITVQKLAENELLRKNQLLSFAEKITMMGNWHWDLVTNIVKWSANLYHIFGLERDTELTFDTYFSFVHPDDREIVTDYFDKAISDRKFIELMHRIQLENGAIKTIQLLAEVITDNLGNVIEMVGTCQDVTVQRMAENKFRGLLESAPDAMVIVNEGGKIQLINKQAEKLFGYSLEELFDKSVEILIPERFMDNHHAHRGSFFSNPKVRAMGVGKGKELFGVNKHGIEIPIQISLSPLQTEEGLLVSAAIRDITEQKLAQNKIIEAKESLEVLAQKLTAQNTQLADFTHITSHNLRAPVSNLNSLLHFYNTSENEEDKAYVFEKFEKVIFHLTQTLNTLVEAIKTKKVSSENLKKITFDDVLIKTKEILSSKILKSGILITSDFSKVEKIYYNEVYLESIFLNLVDNAIKYSHKERIPELHIESDIENGVISLKFADNGMGIDLVRHGHKLFGLNKVFHRHPDAKGVGLFMTKTQVEAMGGVISASSKVDHGTTFNINFSYNE